MYNDARAIDRRIESDVFLVDANILTERLAALLDGRIFAMADKPKALSGSKSITVIPRFEPADVVMGMVFRILLNEDILVSGMKNPLMDKELVVFFSPHGYEFIGKIAEEYCRQTAMRKKTLLLDLRAYTEKEATGEEDIGDLIYYLRTKDIPASQIMNACVREKDGFMYVGCFKEPRDMEDISQKDLSMLINRLTVESDHGVIVFVLPDRPLGVDVMLDNCTGFYLVYRGGGIYQDYVRAFERSLANEESEKIYTLVVDEKIHADMLRGNMESMNAFISKNTGGS